MGAKVSAAVAEFSALYNKAWAAGKAAADACVPAPMVVGDADIFGNPVPGGRMYVVNDGPCGFAWVRVRPGNSAFAKWLVKNGLARPDRYHGGVAINIFDYNQSIARKEAHAYAMARVLEAAGFRAYSDSRLD